VMVNKEGTYIKEILSSLVISYKLGIINPTHLTEILSSRFVRKGVQKDCLWFVFYIISSKIQSLFLVNSG
jgi:phage-related holin